MVTITSSFQLGLLMACRILPVVGVALFAAPAQALSPLEGTWRTLNGTEVAIAPCGDGYCGTLSYVVIPQNYSMICRINKGAFANALTDARNPNSQLQSRPLVGLQMLRAQPTADPNAYTATVYNAETGETAVAIIWVDTPGTLKLGACNGPACVVAQEWPKVPTRLGPPDFSCG